MKYIITFDHIEAFRRQLIDEERSAGTVEKYLRDTKAFTDYLAGRPATRELAVAWKELLISRGYANTSVNAMLAGVNHFFEVCGWPELRIKPLRLQRRLFCSHQRELKREEYDRLVEAAYAAGKERLALLMEAICATGIRVSEVCYLTVEAAQSSRAEVSLKGKIRTILLPGKLCRKLLRYAKKNKITSGEIFLTRSGKRLSRKQIWAEMKSLCQKVNVAPSKVFPHNLRHLFARTFYKVCRDVVKLADILGHSSVETTRIYLVSTGEEHAQVINRMRLVS